MRTDAKLVLTIKWILLTLCFFLLDFHFSSTNQHAARLTLNA